jgi:primary-amine oxidase
VSKLEKKTKNGKETGKNGAKLKETTVRASGYIQSAFYAKNDGYGYRIHDALSGSMHDHILNFKADIDILGTNNTMVKHIFEPIETTYPWSNVTKSTMHLARKEIKSEDEGKMVCLL